MSPKSYIAIATCLPVMYYGYLQSTMATCRHADTYVSTVWNIWNNLEHLEQFGTHRIMCYIIWNRRLQKYYACSAHDSLIVCLGALIPPCLRMVRQQKNGRKNYVPLLMVSFSFTKCRCQQKEVIGAKRLMLSGIALCLRVLACAHLSLQRR